MKELSEKLFSRKLAAFIVATIALWAGAIDQGTWQAVAIAYIGSQALVDLVGAGIERAKRLNISDALKGAAK